MKTLTTVLLTIMAMTTASTGLATESYPTQPIRLIVPFGAGEPMVWLVPFSCLLITTIYSRSPLWWPMPQGRVAL